jgi:ribosomal protein S6
MNEEKDQKVYEIALLLKGEEDLIKIPAFLRDRGAEPLSEGRAKKLALAYKIKGNTEAVFASSTFRASGEDAKKIERDLITNPLVIRSMVLIAPPVSERPSAPLTFPPQQRGRPTATRTSSMADMKPAASRPLSNEALEKKIEEILQ